MLRCEGRENETTQQQQLHMRTERRGTSRAPSMHVPISIQVIHIYLSLFLNNQTKLTAPSHISILHRDDVTGQTGTKISRYRYMYTFIGVASPCVYTWSRRERERKRGSNPAFTAVMVLTPPPPPSSSTAQEIV